MASTDLKYHVCQIDEDPQTKGVAGSALDVVGESFSSTRDAERWVRDYGDDGVKYVVIKITRSLRVETVKKRRVCPL